jgi:hypothetical protein
VKFDAMLYVVAKYNFLHVSRILENIGKLMDEIIFTGPKIREDLTNLVVEAWDVANKTTPLTFKSDGEESGSVDDSLVSVNLPVSLIQRYKKKQRITFINFDNDKLFQSPNVDKRKTFINSKIVSASVKVRFFYSTHFFRFNFTSISRVLGKDFKSIITCSS